MMRTTVKQMTQNLLTKITLIALCGWVMVACNQKEEEVDRNVTIKAINPNYGGAGKTITITGSNFNLQNATPQITFGQQQAKLIKSTEDSIVVEVPTGLTPWQKTDIKVVIADKTIEQSAAFDVTGWNRLNDFAGVAREGGLGFAINNKGYFGGGQNVNDEILSDFWAYEPSSDTWTQLADLGGGARAFANHFVIDSKGYIAAGNTPVGDNASCWEYNPSTNLWTKKASIGPFSSVLFTEATSFAINGNGYILGSQFWEYDQANDTWQQLTAEDFGSGSTAAVANGKAYINNAKRRQTAATTISEWWEFDPTTKILKRLPNLPRTMPASHSMTFTLKEKVYITQGQTSDEEAKSIWQYEPITGIWTEIRMLDGYEDELGRGIPITNPTVFDLTKKEK